MTAELTVGAVARIAVALASGLGVIVAVEHRHLRELPTRTLFLRWRTWALAAPMFVTAALAHPMVAASLVSALSIQGLREYMRLTSLPRIYRIPLYVAGALSAPIAILSMTLWRGMPPILLVAATLVPILRQDVRAGARDLAYAALGFAYIPWLLTYFVLIRQNVEGGAGVVLALGTAVACSDVAAFVAGKLFGRHALASALSPNKTWEGVGGNLLGAYAGFALMSFATRDVLEPALAVLLPAIVAAGAVWGDLVESLLKRQFGVKDAGTCLPGFGGVLDRIDSLLLVLPLAYTVIVLWP